MAVSGQFTLRIFLTAVASLLVTAAILPLGKDVVLINGHHHQLVDLISPWITEMGNPLYYLPVFVLLLFVRFRCAMAFTLAGLFHGIVVLILKRIIFPNALRPVGVLAASQLHFVPGTEVHKLMSFPSGHTATAFAFMFILALYWNNRWGTIFLAFLAILAGLSRVYLLQHFMIDVAAGAAIGMLSAWAAYILASQNQSWPWLDWRLMFYVRKSNTATDVQQPAPAQG